jgi:hypothetical protein
MADEPPNWRDVLDLLDDALGDIQRELAEINRSLE